MIFSNSSSQLLHRYLYNGIQNSKSGGEGGIRTHGTREGTLVFKTSTLSQTLSPLHLQYLTQETKAGKFLLYFQ